MTGVKQMFVGGLLVLGLGAPSALSAQTTADASPEKTTSKHDVSTPDTAAEADSDGERPTPSAETREKVSTLLGGIESNPTPEQWRALDDDAVVVLIEIARDRSIPVVRRGRAVTALVHFDTAEAQNLATELVTAEQTPKHLRRKAMYTVAKLRGEAALPALEPHLAAKSARLREAAIDAVGEIRTAAAKALLRARFSAESQDYLKAKIGEYLAQPTRTSGSLQPLADVPVETEESAR